MIQITDEPWQVMVEHACSTYPIVCCGVMLGTTMTAAQPDASPAKEIVRAIPLENVYEGGQADRYEIRPTDLLRAEREARENGLTMLGIYHSHPDCAAFFSKTDLENSCPWYTFLVISVEQGEFKEANCFQPNADCTSAAAEILVIPEGSAPASLSPAKDVH